MNCDCHGANERVGALSNTRLINVYLHQTNTGMLLVAVFVEDAPVSSSRKIQLCQVSSMNLREWKEDHFSWPMETPSEL